MEYQCNKLQFSVYILLNTKPINNWILIHVIGKQAS